ncbi:DUF1707 SHOCT-like domain-containing protein [Actinomycetospora cinnamomea]|uniref:Uncharacterized protein DUF1707 n=1 Tax=Actinomycetospora cinnamomea TaxID=663609 RepID=A0A2U1FLW2_9PSEU|nr:DUF1707 domain-containing protein [Actinomycetospora cinnamomea]PVZ13157.1 uncharacterized protein DUF1707 [Actinomycetospora cinnamomea]
MAADDATGDGPDRGRTPGGSPAPEPGGLRAGDADREAVAAVLRDALGEGRLDLAEVDERLARAYAARTYAELDPLVADLPATLPWQRPPAPREERPLVLSAGWSSEKRTGAWRVPPRIVAEPSMSDVKLDFREVASPPPRIDLEVQGGMGNVVLVLPDDWAVDTDELRSTWGTVKNRHRGTAGPGRPTIHVTGTIGLGTFRTRGPYFYE